MEAGLTAEMGGEEGVTIAIVGSCSVCETDACNAADAASAGVNADTQTAMLVVRRAKGREHSHSIAPQ